jgi:hypothetical protein
MINKTGFKDIDIVYNQITKDFVNPWNNVSECIPGWRPLLSNILICRRVYFYPYEYNEVDGKVKINGFRNKLSVKLYVVLVFNVSCNCAMISCIQLWLLDVLTSNLRGSVYPINGRNPFSTVA